MRRPFHSREHRRADAPRRPAVPYSLITRDEELASLYDRLTKNRCARLAIDVETEHNLHRYGIHVCLIQLFDGERAIVIDVLALKNPERLAPLLVKAPWTLVWFDATSDLLSIQHDLGLMPSPILDLAVAARLLGKTGGLSALTPRLESASAKGRLQKSNWMRRPIPPDMLDYAVADVMGLFPLADSLLPELAEKGLMAEFMAHNRAAEVTERSWDPFSNYTRIPGFKRLRPEGRRLAMLLWYARELYGKKRDLPSANVASKEDLRHMVDHGLHSAEAIASYLNNKRNRHMIDPGQWGACLREAEKMILELPQDNGRGSRR
jgi:ribonuclease D